MGSDEASSAGDEDGEASDKDGEVGVGEASDEDS